MEPSTAQPLPVLVEIQGRHFVWSPQEGLDPAVVLTVRGYIYQQALRLAGPAFALGHSIDDLVQEGNLGALMAAQRFDPRRGARFLTYAGWWIKQRMLAALGQDAISIPPRTREALRKAGELPPCASLDLCVGSEEDNAWVDLLAGDDPELQSIAESLDMEGHLGSALAKLSAEDRILLVRRYGLGGLQEESLGELSAILGVTRECVRQRQIKAERRLRRLMRRKRPA
jgi:RNA polymerase nonessential primary-like sigma factor